MPIFGHQNSHMSSSLYWLPPPHEREGHRIVYLKYQIGGFYHEDYRGENFEVNAGSELIPFLKGIIAGEGPVEIAKDAKSLIAAIEKFGSVELCCHS
jgi:hypothetical protein